MSRNTILINRAPVLTLWASVVAERLGFHADEAQIASSWSVPVL